MGWYQEWRKILPGQHFLTLSYPPWVGTVDMVDDLGKDKFFMVPQDWNEGLHYSQLEFAEFPVME